MEQHSGKLVLAILQGEDYEDTVYELNQNGFFVTMLSSTGGFLKRGNTTLMIGTEDENVQKATAIIREVCGERKNIEVNMPFISPSGGAPMYCSSVPQRMEVGGAVIFVLDVSYYEKI